MPPRLSCSDSFPVDYYFPNVSSTFILRIVSLFMESRRHIIFYQLEPKFAASKFTDRLRRWTNVESTLIQRLMSARMAVS